MTLRFNTLLNLPAFLPIKKTLVFLVFLLFCPSISQAQTSMDDVKKEAKRLFEDDEFIKAYKLYAQLVSNFPKEPEFNYRLGVCMIYAEPDKKKCIPYLQQAAANPNDAPKDVNFYLGKAHHINYLFDEAIKYYNEFKKTASVSLQKKLQVDREIKACNNGKFLLSNLTDLVVQSKKELNEADYFRSYDLRSIGGKLLVKPDDFRSTVDKKKKEKSIVFLPKGSDVVYFSSYGENTENGKDIYTATKSADGSFGKPQKVPGINTEFDEDYPFLHPDGKTLYFASKGHNSMGGYDIFKSTFNEGTNAWSAPVNLEFPINSPDDDFLFVTDSLEKTAYFSTGRQSAPGKIDVLKINTERKLLDVLVIRGTVLKSTEGASQSSVFNVKDAASDKPIGIFSAQDDGEYNMVLPNGSKLLFTVETPGFKTQSQEVSLPLATNSRSYKQSVIYENGVLQIRNQFDENGEDDSYLQYLKVIEQKARLDVNEGENKLPIPGQGEVPNLDSTFVQGSKNKSVKPKLVEQETLATPTTGTTATAAAEENKPVNNTQLAEMAKQDAEELKQEADQLSRDASDAVETGKKQKVEAEKKLSEANEAIKIGEGIENEEEKKSILGKAIDQKKLAEGEIRIADRILAYGQSLENDAKEKKKESELNDEYSRELQKSTTSKNNKETLTRIEELQKLLGKTEVHKNESENIINALKTEIEQKESQITTVEKLNTDLRQNIEELKNSIAGTETEISTTRKKAKKEELTQQLTNYKIDKEEKEKEMAGNDTELAKLNEELAGLKSELEITNKIKTEDIAKTATTPIETKPEPKPSTVAPKAIDGNSLRDKYLGKIEVNDINNKLAIEASSQELNNYNKEIDQLIAKNKTAVTKAKTAAVKTELNNEIKQLELSKKKNNDQLATNKKLIQNINTQASINAAKNQDIAATYSPLKAESGADAVTKLDKLDAQLLFNDNENFDFNGYQNPQAQSLKVEADTRINDAVARQKKLKEEILASREDIKRNPSPAASSPALPPINVETLNKEAEELHTKSVDLFKESKTKEGPDKDKLLAESRALEDQVNDKYIAIARVTERENQSNFDTNNENIKNLIAENKSPEADATQAKQLNEEASLAYKKAIEIRAEASGLTNSGAKLGSFSNAEEKEAEAVLKQQQAIDLLKKSNPTFALKTPAAPGSASGETQGNDVNAQLEKVNTGIDELANIKIESYQKLNEANTKELDELTNNITANQTSLDSNPRLKTDFLAASKKLDESKKSYEEVDKATNSGEKLAKLVASIKKQNEAIKELTALNKTVVAQVASNTNPGPAPTNTVSPVAATNTANNTITETQTNQTTTENSSAAATATVQTPPVNAPEPPPLISKTDTSATQVLSYFANNTNTLKNQQADAQLKNSLNQLKNYEKEIASINDQIKNPTVVVNSRSGQTSEQLKNGSDSLVLVGEELGTQSFRLRKEADTKTGEEKENLLKQAREIDEQALDNNIEAANLLLRSNEMDVKANMNAILELLGKLAADNPALRQDLMDKNIELENLALKAGRLREEANSLPNRAARLGALSNAEEKEAELIQKQTDLLNEMKKVYPEYVVKPVSEESSPTLTSERTEQLEQKKKDLQTKQYNELTNLTNALSLEYEASKNNVPKNLNKEQQTVKQNADNLNTESKTLLVKASKEKNDNEKVKLLSLAAKSGNEAINQLNKITVARPAKPAVAKANTPAKQPKNNPKDDAVAGNQTTNPLVTAETPVTPNAVKPEVTPPAGNPRTAAAPVNTGALKVAGLEIVKGSAYSDARPIPIDAKIEDGLTFRVQIGAFRTQLPNNTFKGLTPLNGETTASGYFRYTAGNFNKVENANAVKNDLRGLGYSDAFVVAFYNGKRISLAEAFDLLNKEGKTVDPNAPQTAGITANVNVPTITNPNTAPADKLEVSKELEKSNGLLFTIQVGVYNRLVNKQQLLGLKPIFTEQLPNGLYRYTAGIYSSTDRLINDKKKVVEFGIRDAFISAYLNGKKIAFAEAKDKQANDASIKMNDEDPVVFPTGTAAVGNAPANAATNLAPANVKPFSNGVSAYPDATSENGIKKTEEGITFKVQVAAYSKQVPNDVAAKLSAIKTWPVENKQINGLYIYNIGNFSEAKYAKALKEEAIKVGLSDAFITVYQDGKKLYGAEASQYLNR